MKKALTLFTLLIMLSGSSATYGQFQNKFKEFKQKYFANTKYRYFDYDGYDRKAFTVLYFNDVNDNKSKEVGANCNFNYKNLTSKFDYNDIGAFQLSGSSEIKKEVISSILKDRKIPNDAMDYVMDGDWKLPLETINNRAIANKTDSERKRFEQSLSGSNQSELASDFYEDINPVVQENYILSISTKNVKTYQEKYDEIDRKERERVEKYNKNLPSGSKREVFQPVQRIYRGYIADLSYFVYQIDLNSDSIINVFWNNCYPNETFRNNFNYPLKLVTNGVHEIESAQHIDIDPELKRSMEELYSLILTNETINNILTNTLAEVQEFKVMNPIYSTSPIAVKIGAKENLKKHSKYFVYEQTVYDNNKTRWHRYGVMRANKVVNNNVEKIKDEKYGIKVDSNHLVYKYSAKSKVDTSKSWILEGRYLRGGDFDSHGLSKSEVTVQKGVDEKGMVIPSTFYQIEGGRIAGLGTMLAIEQPSINLFITPSFGSHGFNIDLAYQYLGVKVFLDLGFDGYKFKEQPYLIIDKEKVKTNVLLFSLYFGLAKDFYFMRNAVVTPHIGIGTESAGFLNSKLNKNAESNDGDSYGNANTTINIGTQLGYTIFHRAKAVVGLDYFPVSYKNNTIFGENENLAIKRSPMRIYFGIRYEL